MSTKKEWHDDKVNVNKLSLDLQNPRVPKHVKDFNDVNQIRNYLLEKESVLKIARSIANNGYHRSAVTIICKENGKLIVLDGNRRLAACQFLLNPKFSPNARDRKELDNLNKVLDKKQLENIKITIAPSRKEAEKEIWDIHVNRLLKSWEVLQRLRTYRNLLDSGDHDIDSAASDYGTTITKFKQELAKLYFYEQILERLGTEKEEEELSNSGFNKIDRLILSTNGKKFLDYTVDSKGNITINHQKDFDKKLEKLIPYVVIPNKISPQATQEQIEESVFFVIDPTNFSKKLHRAKGKGGVKRKEAKKIVHGTLVKSDWVTRGEYTRYKGAERVKRMLEEMYKLNPPDKNKNILIVSLRVLLELSLCHKLYDKGYIAKMEKDYKALIKAKNAEKVKKGEPLVSPKENWTPSFRKMLDYVIKESNGVIDDSQARDALKKVIKGETNFVEDFNIFAHNVHYIPKKGDPEKIWSQFGRLLFDVISKIK